MTARKAWIGAAMVVIAGTQGGCASDISARGNAVTVVREESVSCDYLGLVTGVAVAFPLHGELEARLREEAGELGGNTVFVTHTARHGGRMEKQGAVYRCP